jgi:hypothetical protein
MTGIFRWSGPAVGSFPKEHESLLRFFCAAIAIFLLLSCSKAGPPPELRIEHEVTPQPLHVGAATITLRLTDAAARPVAGAQIGLEADMSHPGMSPVSGDVREVEPGLYRGQLEFGMAGDWVILLHVALPNGQKLERQFDAPGVRPN